MGRCVICGATSYSVPLGGKSLELCADHIESTANILQSMLVNIRVKKLATEKQRRTPKKALEAMLGNLEQRMRRGVEKIRGKNLIASYRLAWTPEVIRAIKELAEKYSYQVDERSGLITKGKNS